MGSPLRVGVLSIAAYFPKFFTLSLIVFSLPIKHPGLSVALLDIQTLVGLVPRLYGLEDFVDHGT